MQKSVHLDNRKIVVVVKSESYIWTGFGDTDDESHRGRGRGRRRHIEQAGPRDCRHCNTAVSKLGAVVTARRAKPDGQVFAGQLRVDRPKRIEEHDDGHVDGGDWVKEELKLDQRGELWDLFLLARINSKNKQARFPPPLTLPSLLSIKSSMTT